MEQTIIWFKYFFLKMGYDYKIDNEIIFYYRIHSENYTKKIRKQFYNKNLKGFLLLNSLGLISEKEVAILRKDNRIKKYFVEGNQ